MRVRVSFLFLSLSFLCLSLRIESAGAWEDGEFEMFDLVEEVGQNFYEVLEIPQESSAKEIKQAYRKLSLKLHPDKNPSPDADVKFRQLVGIYEVLKDPMLRDSYHQVLIDGLPNWRHPSYYYRRVRKLALWQVTLIVLAIVSIGQYLAGWAAYWEKKQTIQEMIDAKLRRTQRTRKGQKEYKEAQSILQAEAEQFLNRPSVWDVAPFQILRFTKYLILEFPGETLQFFRDKQREKAEEERRRVEEEEQKEAERLVGEEPKKPRKRKTFQVPERAEGEEEEGSGPTWGTRSGEETQGSSVPHPVLVRGGLWTDEDIAELVKLCSKFPGGTPERWDKISVALGRPLAEVTFMAKKVLEKLSVKGEEKEETGGGVGGGGGGAKVKVKTKGGKSDPLDAMRVESWTVEEQRALESALLLFPKGSLDRWDKIAHLVPARSKEECMERFKYVADLVRKSREEKKREEEEKDKEYALGVGGTEEVEVVEEQRSGSRSTTKEKVLPTPTPTKTTPSHPQPQSQSPHKTEEMTEGVGVEEEEVEEEDYSASKSKGKGKRGKKGRKERRKRRESFSSDSSSVSDQDWCLVEDPNTNTNTNTSTPSPQDSH